MAKSQEKTKLFTVEGKSSNSGVSRMVNYGDNYGERYPFTKHVAAKSPEDAIAQVKQGFEDRIKRHDEAVDQAKKMEEEKGKPLSPWELLSLGLGPLPPSIPRDIEKWKATEIKIPGYRITLEKVSQEVS